ncbi:MAG: hypothetical protein ABSF29_06190 [Tepidisphaeraceae bacterium]|jgi:hypothetical protein
MSEQIGRRSELIQLLDDEPFAPFEIVMGSGDRYRITDPHSVAVGRDVICVLPRVGASSVLRFNQVNALHIRKRSSRR